MKTLLGLLLFVLLGVGASGQQSGGAKVIAEISASSDKVVKGSPFSAEAVSESVQVLADGNRIVRSSTSKMYRNSEGRFRREMSGGSGNLLGTAYSYGQGISILDPVAGNHYLLDSALKTAKVIDVRPMGGVAIAGTIKGDAQRVNLAEKLAVTAAKERAGTAAVVVAGGQNLTAYSGTLMSSSGGQGFAYSLGGSHSKYETKTEQLGTQNIEGVNAEGTRTITTIPAGAIGNERPIEMVYEKWYSNELQLVVMSKHNDPRFGEQTYRLTNIVRNEPDPSLFSLPTGYKLLTEPASVYRFNTTKVEAEKAAAARTVSTVERTKP